MLLMTSLFIIAVAGMLHFIWDGFYCLRSFITSIKGTFIRHYDVD